MVKWTRDEILREILQREEAGLPLSLGGLKGINSQLYCAGSRIFGSWPNALRAAGISPDQVLLLDRWKPARVLSVIRTLARRSEPIRFRDLNEEYGHIVSAARRYFGSWSRACLAAKVDPAKLRRSPPWTKEGTIEAILFRALNNQPLWSHQVRPKSLVVAGARFFDSWPSALIAAGLDPTKHIHHPRGLIMRPKGADTENVGIGSSMFIRPGAGQYWSKEAVIQFVLKRKSDGLLMTASAVFRDDRPLYRAAARRYGCWRDALIAAGLTY